MSTLLDLNRSSTANNGSDCYDSQGGGVIDQGFSIASFPVTLVSGLQSFSNAGEWFTCAWYSPINFAYTGVNFLLTDVTPLSKVQFGVYELDPNLLIWNLIAATDVTSGVDGVNELPFDSGFNAESGKYYHQALWGNNNARFNYFAGATPSPPAFPLGYASTGNPTELPLSFPYNATRRNIYFFCALDNF